MNLHDNFQNVYNIFYESFIKKNIGGGAVVTLHHPPPQSEILIFQK